MKSLGIGVDGMAFLLSADELKRGGFGQPFSTETAGVSIWATVKAQDTNSGVVNESATHLLQSLGHITMDEEVDGPVVFANRDTFGGLTPLNDEDLEEVGLSVVNVLVAHMERVIANGGRVLTQHRALRIA